ncbi:MAG TPA: RNA 2',3'-cyclic phosphodiesterase [Woeseiaceae bacterium]|nr:RNA 2',3'-cyclic phosphodiesterase [Woeseiaceae bacterium]
MTTKRVFFALWPDARQRDRLRDVINSVARNVEGRAVDRRDWHITLAYLGDIEEQRIPGLLQRAKEIHVEPFRLAFDRLEFWPRPKIACLVTPTVPVELETLVAELNALIQDCGVVPEDRTYRPHITVSRNARTFPTERLTQRATTEWSGFELIESVTGPGGSSYMPLKQ